MSDKTSRIFHI